MKRRLAARAGVLTVGCEQQRIDRHRAGRRQRSSTARTPRCFRPPSAAGAPPMRTSSWPQNTVLQRLDLAAGLGDAVQIGHSSSVGCAAQVLRKCGATRSNEVCRQGAKLPPPEPWDALAAERRRLTQPAVPTWRQGRHRHAGTRQAIRQPQRGPAFSGSLAAFRGAFRGPAHRRRHARDDTQPGPIDRPPGTVRRSDARCRRRGRRVSHQRPFDPADRRRDPSRCRSPRTCGWTTALPRRHRRYSRAVRAARSARARRSWARSMSSPLHIACSTAAECRRTNRRSRRRHLRRHGGACRRPLLRQVDPQLTPLSW